VCDSTCTEIQRFFSNKGDFDTPFLLTYHGPHKKMIFTYNLLVLVLYFNLSYSKHDEQQVLAFMNLSSNLYLSNTMLNQKSAI